MNPDLFELETIPKPPKIDPVPEGVERPFFSVIIPVCNRIKYLRQAIESVLNEKFSLSDMQICIVDNSTETIDWTSFLTDQERRRIEIFKQPKHVGLPENWNTCITQSRGQFVHILHDDDWILPGFYDEIKRLSEIHHSSALIATRNVVVDEHGTWNFISSILETHKSHSTCCKVFYFETPIQCSAIVVRRGFYENFGGFLTKPLFVIDCEMWSRATKNAGAVISDKVLAAYRVFDQSGTAKISQSSENLKDILRLTQLFKQSYQDFPYEEAINRLFSRASEQAKRFRAIGNTEAAKAAEDFADALTPPQPPMPSGLAWFLYGFSNFLRRQADKIYLKN